MTDLELIQRIAEIEGEPELSIITSQRIIDKLFNILVDDALCFQLMIKHKIALNYEAMTDRTSFAAGYMESMYVERFIFDESANRAIGLAIIKKHENREEI